MTELIRIGLAELPAPFLNGFVRYQHTTNKEEFFDVPIAEAEAIVQPHSMANDLCGKPMVFVGLRGWLEESCLLAFSVRLYDRAPCLHRRGDDAILVKGQV